MATLQQIAELRDEIQEPLNQEPYTDDYLGALIDDYGMDEAAHKIWIAKRNAVAALVDISEGGSSRKMSQLFDQYSKIVATYEEDPIDPVGTRRPPRTREITRS